MFVYSKVKEAITQFVEIDPAAITLESSIKDDLGADAIAVIDILMDLEEAFDIHIPEKKIGLKVDDIVNYIQDHAPAERKNQQHPEEVKKSA